MPNGLRCYGELCKILVDLERLKLLSTGFVTRHLWCCAKAIRQFFHVPGNSCSVLRYINIKYEGESNKNLEYILSCNLLNTKGTQ